jgi:sugar/nucleoside kinase (ribokinase family)
MNSMHLFIRFSWVILFAQGLLCAQQKEGRVLGLLSPEMRYVTALEEADLTACNLKKGEYQELDGALFTNTAHCFQNKERMQPSCASNTIKGLAALGMEVSLSERRACSPIIFCLKTPDGEATFCSQQISSSHPPLNKENFRDVALLHIDGVGLFDGLLIEQTMHLAKEMGVKISFDLANSDLAALFRERIFALLERYVDILFLNEAQADTLAHLPPKEAAHFLKNFCNIVVVTSKSEGCWVGSERTLFHAPAITTSGIEKRGREELFASAFLYGYLHDYSLKTCARIGNIATKAAGETAEDALSESQWREIRHLMSRN